MDKNLELIGATWMTVPPDSYVEFSYIQSGRDESTYCSDVEGWEPNKTCTASNVLFISSVLLLGCIFLNIFTAWLWVWGRPRNMKPFRVENTHRTCITMNFLILEMAIICLACRTNLWTSFILLTLKQNLADEISEGCQILWLSSF